MNDWLLNEIILATERGDLPQLPVTQRQGLFRQAFDSVHLTRMRLEADRFGVSMNSIKTK